MDGYEATREIRKLNQEIPIIAMTANASKGDAQKCLDAGMNDYVSKPLDFDIFATVVNRWVKQACSFQTRKRPKPCHSPIPIFYRKKFL